MTSWPGDPRGVWERESARDAWQLGQTWLPSPDDLPPRDSPEALDAHYSVVPVWWQRWVLPMLVAAVCGILLIPVALWQALAWEGAARIAGWMFVAVVSAAGVVVLIRATVKEAAFRRTRTAQVREVYELLERRAVPVWAVLEDRVRVSDGGDGAYDLQFVFDLRVPRATLAVQRRVVEAWLDRIADTLDTAQPEYFVPRFARDAPVHCVDVFGEGMRGVWIWSKPSILPIQVLGLAVDDPRTAAALAEENVAFLHDQPRELRRRSTITRRR